MIKAQAIWYGAAGSALSMEAEAILDAVRLATNNPSQPVEIETDAQEMYLPGNKGAE